MDLLGCVPRTAFQLITAVWGLRANAGPGESLQRRKWLVKWEMAGHSAELEIILLTLSGV